MSFFEGKVFKIIKSVINVFIVVLVLLFVLAVCLQRFSNNRLSFFNYRMFTVVSGSMEPKYNIGDVLLAKDVSPDKIKVGDAVSYIGRSGTFADKVVTHQVVEIEKDNDGKFVYHTKGLANIVEDPIVYEDQVYGVVIHKVFLLSFVYRAVRTPIGMFLLVGLPIMYIIGSEFIIAMLENEEKRRAKLRKNVDEDDDDEEEEDDDEFEDDDTSSSVDEEKEEKKEVKTTKKSSGTTKKSTTKSTSSKASSTKSSSTKKKNDK